MYFPLIHLIQHSANSTNSMKCTFIKLKHKPSWAHKDIQMPTYTGHGGSRYDSKAEAAASYKLSELGFMRSNDRFSQTFKDSAGTEFRACPDFHHARYGLRLEFKAAGLNGVKTKASADKQIADRVEYRGGTLNMKDRLDFQWNHSKKKQAIVQAALTPDRFIVCFAKPPAFAEALVYLKAGILFCTLASLPSYLGYIRLKQRGLAVAFSESYTLTDETGTTYPAGFTYGPA